MALQPQARELQGLDLERLVIDIFVGTCYCRTPQLFVGITSQLAARLGFSNRRDAIQSAAEITAVLCHTDAFGIIKESPEASMMLKSRIPLPDELIESIQLALYPALSASARASSARSRRLIST